MEPSNGTKASVVLEQSRTYGACLHPKARILPKPGYYARFRGIVGLANEASLHRGDRQSQKWVETPRAVRQYPDAGAGKREAGYKNFEE
ncbi:MAG: hypothetical protein CYPHOPRED_002640, partial [Cyphobasidiales sp. Tagirdzhanova-0007]